MQPWSIKRRTTALVVLGSVVLLLATNPSLDDYANYARGLAITHKVRPEVVAQVDMLIRSSTHRRNYYVFSVYTTAMDNTNPMQFVGVLGQFVRR